MPSINRVQYQLICKIYRQQDLAERAGSYFGGYFPQKQESKTIQAMLKKGWISKLNNGGYKVTDLGQKLANTYR